MNLQTSMSRVFLGFSISKICFFGGTGHSCCIFGLLNKSCIWKCFIFSTVFFWVQFYSPGASIIMGPYYYRIMHDFCEMNSVFEGIFRVLLLESIFLGFLLVAKYFWVVQKYPTPPIPVCRFVKSIPWVVNMVTHVSDWVLSIEALLFSSLTILP